MMIWRKMVMWLLDPFWPFSLLVDYNISIPEGIHGRKYQIKYSWLKKSKECDHFIFIFPFCLCLVIHIPFLPLVSKQDPQRHSWAEVKAAAGTIPTSTSFQHFHHQHHHYHHWANCDYCKHREPIRCKRHLNQFLFKFSEEYLLGNLSLEVSLSEELQAYLKIVFVSFLILVQKWFCVCAKRSIKGDK